MMMLSVAIATTACGSTSHTPDAGVVLPPLDQLLVVPDDIGTCSGLGVGECGCLDGFRRCDTCMLDCPTLTGCVDGAGVCRGFDNTNSITGCTLNFEATATASALGAACTTGSPCAVGTDDTGRADSWMSGSCMPTSFCEAAASADPPSEARCVWSDGSEFLGPPPAGVCPAPQGHGTVFCGGACGEELGCPAFARPGAGDARLGPCVGINGNRAFGVCAQYRELCTQDNAQANWWILGQCEDDDAHDGPCACLVFDEQLHDDLPPVGHVILASACHEYAAHVPGVTCRNAEWNELAAP